MHLHVHPPHTHTPPALVNYRPLESLIEGPSSRRRKRRRSDEADGGGSKKKKKSIGSVSINLASGGLIVALNWVNRIVYLRAVIP